MAITDRRGVSVSATDAASIGDPNPGLAIKTPVAVATTANIALSGAQTIDGVSVGANAERVLVKNQTDATANGIYNASSGDWTRTTDCNSNDKVADGGLVFVLAGTVNASRLYQLNAADPIVLGTSSIAFSLLSFIQAAALSLLGNPTGVSAALTNISAISGSGAVLRESGGALSFGTVATAGITNNAVTYAKLQQVAAASLVGNATGGLANATGITIGATLAFSGAALQTVAITGDVTSSANSFATTLAANIVSNAKFRQSAAFSVVGNATSGTANVADISTTTGSAAVLRESGGALSFGTVATAGIANNAVTNAKLATMATLTIKANITGGTAVPTDNTLSAILDTLTTTQGAILFRGSSAWQTLSPGSNGDVLTSQGTAANPVFSAAGAGGSVTDKWVEHGHFGGV